MNDEKRAALVEDTRAIIDEIDAVYRERDQVVAGQRIGLSGLVERERG